MTIEQDIFGFGRSANSINSKQKGNSNERECAKAMKAWTGLNFVRVPMSGGLRWKDSQNVSADLICDDPNVDFPLTIETKHLKKISVQPLLRSSSMIFKIWQQVMADAIRSSKIPMAMLRVYGMPKGEYYMVLETSLGGTILASQVPVLFSGYNGTYSLIGYKFSDVKNYNIYSKFVKALHADKLISKSKFYVVK